MKSKFLVAFVILTMIFIERIALATTQTPQYLYGFGDQTLPFEISREKLSEIDSPEKSRKLFREMLSLITEDKKYNPYIIEALSVLAEECIRYAGKENPNAVKLDLLDSASQSEIEFFRELRLGTTIKSENTKKFIIKKKDLPTNDIDLIYLYTDFADLRLEVNEIKTLQNDKTIKLKEIITNNSSTISSTALKFWSIWIVLFIVIFTILIEPLRQHKLSRALLLSLCLILYCTNLLLVFFSPSLGSNSVQEGNTYGISVDIPKGITAILSFPISKTDNIDLTVVDIDGEPVPCKYNPITQSIDARINISGVYSLKTSVVYFTDVKNKSPEMQHAIRILTSCGLMKGADERNFLPDREITRAEFLSVILNVTGLIDETAESSFPDVLRSDWFYSVAASSAKVGLISGYNDGSFRGNVAIPKIQMVAVTANALIRKMNYYIPDNVEKILTIYPDNVEISKWAQNGVAIATQSGVILERADRNFDSESVMTRGDAAIILYRLFSKIW